MIDNCPKHLIISVRTIFHDSSLFCLSFCGYNTIFGSHHIKRYYIEDSICAAVIRFLHQSVAGSDYDTEQIIQTVSCD